MFKRSLITLSLTCTFILSPLSALAATKITMPNEVPYERPHAVPLNIQTECGLSTKLQEYIHAELVNQDVEVVSVEDISKAKGKVLDVKISDISGFGGGGWSGPKFMAVTGSLTDNGKKIGSFTASDHSVGGGFSGFVFKGTCNIFDIIAQDLAKDIGNWYANGHDMGARMGN